MFGKICPKIRIEPIWLPKSESHGRVSVHSVSGCFELEDVEEGVSRLKRGGEEEPPGVDEGLALVGSQLVATGVDLEPGEVNVFKLTTINAK